MQKYYGKLEQRVKPVAFIDAPPSVIVPPIRQPVDIFLSQNCGAVSHLTCNFTVRLLTDTMA